MGFHLRGIMPDKSLLCLLLVVNTRASTIQQHAGGGNETKVCHSLSPDVSDQWCDENCNCNPPFCPPTLCKCGPVSPTPQPKQPTPAPRKDLYKCHKKKCIVAIGGVSKEICENACVTKPTPAKPSPAPPTPPQPTPAPPHRHTHFVTYVDALTAWWPATKLAAGIGVPGYANTTKYNIFNIAFWSAAMPLDLTGLWTDPIAYIGTDTPFGTTGAQVRQSWVDAYHRSGAKVLVSAFGATNHPCSGGENAQQTCTQLAQWAKDNNFDGVDLDFEDSGSFNANGDGEAWLIECTRTIRDILPSGEYLLTHAPQAPYFDGLYPHGGYLAVHGAVGDLIDWYNIQFYNQGIDGYDSYSSLFEVSGGWATGTSVNELVAKGIARKQIVIGKPTSPKEADNTGFLTAKVLKGIFSRAKKAGNSVGGMMTWQYADDLDGEFIAEATSEFPQI
jgi:chitinase